MTKKNKESYKSRFVEPSLIIPSEIYKKLMFWVDYSNFECSWLGTLDHDKINNIFTVMDIFLLKQKNTSSSTDLDPNEITKLLYEQRDNPYDIRWWGHSHVNMNVFWSVTDMTAMENLSDGGWFVSTVFNKKREMKTALSQLSPIPLFVDNIETHIIDSISEKEKLEWEQEYKEKVTNNSIVSYTFSSKNYDYYNTSSKNSTKQKIPAPANMPNWKEYLDDKYDPNLYFEYTDNKKRSSSSSDDEPTELSEKEMEIYNEIYYEYMSMKNNEDDGSSEQFWVNASKEAEED